MMRSALGIVILPLMNDTPKQTGDVEDRSVLLIEQLELLKTKKSEVEELLARGGRVGEGLVDDLVGIVLMLCAALLADEALDLDRGELEVYERKARELLGDALLD